MENDSGLIVELPDGKLFRLSNANGRVVEMPNGSIVEMVDGQVVEMSNGQQLEMVEGNLVELRPVSLLLEDGDCVGHRLLDLETSRRVIIEARGPPLVKAAGRPQARQPLLEEQELPASDKRQLAMQEERLRRHQLHVMNREEQLAQQAQQLGEKDKAMTSKQQQLVQQHQSLKAQEEELKTKRSQLMADQEALDKRSAALDQLEQELKAREAKLMQQQQEIHKWRDHLKQQDMELRAREAAIEAKGGSTSSKESKGGSTSSKESKEEGKGGGAEPKSAIESIEAGRIKFSDITLGGLLGSGSFADVFRGEWRVACAVKKMKGRISKEQMTEFVREGEMMRSLKHPGIVKLLGVSVEGGSFYLVQEMVTGHGNLFDYLHKKKCRLTYWQLLQVSSGISEAMAYLHERLIVHRDLKPQNCLLVNDRGLVKLCDFGLARLRHAAFVETKSNTAGTPAYQAPEMLRDEPISEKVDLYGFGVMLWEMATGNLPWSDKTYHQMIHLVAVLHHRPPIPPTLPKDLVGVLESCWHRQPEKRPPFHDLLLLFRDLSRSLPPDIPKNPTASSSSAATAMPSPARPPPIQHPIQLQQGKTQPIGPQQPHHFVPPVVYGGFQPSW